MGTFRFTILAVLAYVATAAGVTDTIRFDIAGLRIDRAARIVEYYNLENIDDSGRPGVPVASFTYRTDRSAHVPAPSCRVFSADTIELDFHPVSGAPDVITADAVFSVPRRSVLPASDGRYPAEAGVIHGRRAALQAVWTVVLHPFQYVDGDRIVFNHAIEISLPGDEITMMDNDGESRVFRRPYATPLFDDDSSGCPLGHEYIIVTSVELADAFVPLLELKRQTGYDGVLALSDSICARYGGRDSAEALRAYLADCYRTGAAYVLLGGDEDHVPIRYAYYYETDTIPSLDHLMICDLYFADYDGDWDSDGDGIYGEPLSDSPDMGPEVMLGRLPFSAPWQVSAYIDNLRTYLFDPGDGDRAYLNRSVFFCSDQMRDFFEGGQQYVIAEKFPDHFDADCERLAETPSGIALSPTGPSEQDVLSGLEDGYGMVNILAHGRADGFVIRASDYNLFPKLMLLTPDSVTGHLSFADLPSNRKPGLYYSISCAQAAYDLETLYGMEGLSVVERVLSQDGSGAVGFVAFTRWGWVGSSYKLMASFYEHLFSDAGGAPVTAMHLSHFDHPYYRDQIYGQNFFGDPSLRMYLGVPQQMQLSGNGYYDPGGEIILRLALDGQPLAGQPVTVSHGDTRYETVYSDAEGMIVIGTGSEEIDAITVTASLPGIVAALMTIHPSITADADDGDDVLPVTFELRQNRPNPFNPTTMIEFTLPRRQRVTLEIFDILGRIVSRPVDDILGAGTHQVEWNGADLLGNAVSSGIYIYRIVSDDGMACRKMALVK